MKGPTLAAMSTATPGTRPAADTARLAALDHAHVWHPFTPMRQWCETDPLIIERGEGPYLFDTDGNRYIDGVSSLWCNVHGHHHPTLDRAIRDQLDRVAHTTLLGLASPPSVELAARLVHAVRSLAAGSDVLPLNKVFFTDAGATAVEVALKMAVGYWYHSGRPDKSRIVRLGGSYHGDTAGSMSVGYSELFHRPFRSMLFEVVSLPAIDYAPERRNRPSRAGCSTCDGDAERCRRGWPSECPERGGDIIESTREELNRVVAELRGGVAAVVIEPVMQGAAGMICQPPGFVKMVRSWCNVHEVLLIADEVATGFGRTGTLFACEHDDVVPDILCLAKGLTAGYLPLAATLTTDAVYNAFLGAPHENKTLFHGHTYTGNALACAVALASLDLFDQPVDASPDLLTQIRSSAGLLREKLHQLRGCPHVADVRQRGIMIGIELKTDAAPTSETSRAAAAIAARVCDQLRGRGVLLRPLGNVVVLMPIPATPLETLGQMIDHVLDVILHDVPSMFRSG